MNKYIAILLLAFSGSAVAADDDYDEGIIAFATEDYETANMIFKIYAEKGEPGAQTFIGDSYRLGTGVKQDFKEAANWYNLAAAQGNALAQSNLAYLYYSGNGVVQDYKEAHKFSRLSAEQGNMYAQNNLGVFYQNGTGIDPDQVKAHMWYNLAASQGNDNAAVNRDKLNTSMLPADVAKAQAMARACLANDYKGC